MRNSSVRSYIFLCNFVGTSHSNLSCFGTGFHPSKVAEFLRSFFLRNNYLSRAPSDRQCGHSPLQLWIAVVSSEGSSTRLTLSPPSSGSDAPVPVQSGLYRLLAPGGASAAAHRPTRHRPYHRPAGLLQVGTVTVRTIARRAFFRWVPSPGGPSSGGYRHRPDHRPAGLLQVGTVTVRTIAVRAFFRWVPSPSVPSPGGPSSGGYHRPAGLLQVGTVTVRTIAQRAFFRWVPSPGGPSSGGYGGDIDHEGGGVRENTVGFGGSWFVLDGIWRCLWLTVPETVRELASEIGLFLALALMPLSVSQALPNPCLRGEFHTS